MDKKKALVVCWGTLVPDGVYNSNLMKAQWIFTEKQLREIDKFRLQKYKLHDLEKVNQHYITKVQLSKFIYFMRTRKKQLDYPFKFEKVIYYAVALFRRYYLLNIYFEDDPIRNLICAVYVSLKLNEYDEGFIAKMAIKWKEKAVFCPTKRFPHFGQEGYSQAELSFLSGIKFQTSLSKLIQPIEAIYEQINEVCRGTLSHDHQHKEKNVDFYDLVPEILAQLDKIYYHPTIMFLYEGPKLALAAVVNALKKKHLPLNALGDHLRYLTENNIQEIERIITEIQIDMEDNGEAIGINKSKVPKFKKPDPKKSLSPRFQPRHQVFPE